MTTVKILETSENIGKLEALKFRNFGNSTNIREIVGTVITVKKWAKLELHDDTKSDEEANGHMLLIVEESGEMYRTGSQVFIEVFDGIREALNDPEYKDVPFTVIINEIPLKNKPGSIITPEFFEGAES